MTPKYIFLFALCLSLASSIDLNNFEVLTIGSQTLQNTLEIAKDSQVALKFESNPTTGYNWYIENSETLKSSKVLQALNLNEKNGGEYQENDNPNHLTGMGGNAYFKFRGLNRGKQSIQFRYKRVWETEPLYTIMVDVDVIEIKENL